MDPYRRGGFGDEFLKNDGHDSMHLNPNMHPSYGQYQQMQQQQQDYRNEMNRRSNYVPNQLQQSNGLSNMNTNNQMGTPFLGNNQNFNGRMQNMQSMPNMPSIPNNDVGNSVVPSDDQNQNYYQEYCRLYIANVVLTNQMKELVAEKTDLLTKLGKLEKRREELQNTKNNFDKDEEKKKRSRRTASEIDRHYRCPIEICQKSYGSEGSLNQHIKLKHPEYYAIHLKGKEGSISINKSEVNSLANLAKSNSSPYSDDEASDASSPVRA